MNIPEGTVYKDLTVIREVERSGPNRRFLCRCVCGNESVKFLGNLRMGRSVSCGCLNLTERKMESLQAIAAGRRLLAQVTDEGRLCLTCDTWQVWDQFANESRPNRTGKQSNCITCGRFRTIKALYGISREEWEWMRDAQDGRCALCGEKPTRKNLDIDHDHACCGKGKGCKNCIRGLLCPICNRLLGHVETKPALAVRFSDYLALRPFRGEPELVLVA